jgi:hypothetical protein
MIPPCWYPPERQLAAPPPAAAAIRYERQQGLTDHVTLSNSDATIITFAGTPDAIVLTAVDNSAMFTLTDRLDRDVDNVMVPAGETVTVYLAREKVLARNQSAGQNAKVTVLGLWAARNERGSDPRRGAADRWRDRP